MFVDYIYIPLSSLYSALFLNSSICTSLFIYVTISSRIELFYYNRIDVLTIVRTWDMEYC